MNFLSSILKTFSKKRFSNTKDFLKSATLNESNLSNTQTKFIELPNAFGAFTEEQEVDYKTAIQILTEYLDDVSKIYLLGFSTKKYFIQFDRPEEGKNPSLAMVESPLASLMDTSEISKDDALKALELYWTQVNNG